MLHTSAGLKALLAGIQADDYRVSEGQNYFTTAQEMVAHIGSPDAELRDDLIYDILANWIEAGRLDAGQLKHLLDECLDDSHLFFRIGESGTDSVFTRTFSALAIALIVNAHRKSAFLSAAELRGVLGKVEDYLLRENDLRGYVGGKGWAHAAAHAADMLAALAQCPELSDPAEMRGILAAVHTRVETDDYAYVHEEDERLATVVVCVMGRRILDDSEIVGWLDGFPPTKRIVRYPEDLYLRANVKAFFRSLYFRLAKAERPSPVLGPLKEMMARHSKF